jgi:hypothetical protein
MSEPKAQVTERTFYPALINFIKENGGSGIQEVSFNSEPDILFKLFNRDWLLSVKLGENITILKAGFIQYQRHKEESHLNHGLLLFLPDYLRKTEPTEAAIVNAIANAQGTCLIDTPPLKEEYRSLAFPQILIRLINEIQPKLEQRLEKAFPLKLVIELLQQHVIELMETIHLADRQMLRIITDRKLLSNIGHLSASQNESAGKFLAAYIVLSQILFLRLFGSAQPHKLPPDLRPVTHYSLRKAFSRILEINYRPIYKVDVLDSVSEDYLRDTFDLIWGLEVERSRYELPGRIFHELMPSGIRKMLAAFYTRPQAADILAGLTIQNSNDTVFDPASGSGTILVSAYRRKSELLQEEGKVGNPHKRFCENEIFGADIMPFAVHLTSANLAAMDPGVTIERTQIIQGDSIKLSRGRKYHDGLQLDMFPTAAEAKTVAGKSYEVNLKRVNIVLMNPPFTKVERGIQKYVDMKRFYKVCGGEVGLWGHFITLADDFLEDGGVYGAVIPINILRGRESSKIRKFCLSKWTPLYILKSTANYGFSEWSEYRDILFIARKGVPSDRHKVKFCLVKKDLRQLTHDDVAFIDQRICSLSTLRSEDLDIDSFSIKDLQNRFNNMMWFCGVTNFDHRDILTSFINRFSDKLRRVPDGYFREGYRPVPKGVSSFLFMTRNIHPCRTEEAFLWFNEEMTNKIAAKSHLGIGYEIEKGSLVPTLRTGIGIRTMDISSKWDYVARHPYRAMRRVLSACGFRKPKNFAWETFWQSLEHELNEVKTNLVVIHRINPYSPNTHLVSFLSDQRISPSNVLNVVKETDYGRAKAVSVLMNSIVFLSQFFLLKEETTGRYINVRFYDLEEMDIYPPPNTIKRLAKVFDDFALVEFPSLREQLDANFDIRYRNYWTEKRKLQASMFSDTPIQPSQTRIQFDKAVLEAIGLTVEGAELNQVYATIVNEMILTRGLQRD